jgi:molybdate transport system substrate-binding protein
MSTPRPLAILIGLTLLVAAACAAAPSSGTASPGASGPTTVAPTDAVSGERTQLTVFAAASLRRALEAAIDAYAAAAPGTTISLSTDSSAALTTQIEQGAPADVFLSADTANPQALVDAGLSVGEAVPFAGNELAIIVPSGNPAAIATPADLGRDGVRIIAAGSEVPITRYAAQLVATLAALDGYPADFAAAYEANVVSREDNVAAVVTKIELGEGDAAIVYVTDADASEGPEVVPVPDEANVRASYAGIVVGTSAVPAAGQAFLDWLVGSEGQAVLAGFGFLPPAS